MAIFKKLDVEISSKGIPTLPLNSGFPWIEGTTNSTSTKGDYFKISV